MNKFLMFMLLAIGLASCNPILETGQLIEASEAIIDYEVNDDHIEIFVDAIADTIDQSVILGVEEWGNVFVKADVNANGALDSNVDKQYSRAPAAINPDSVSLCRVLIIDETSTSACEILESGSYEFNFSTSVNSDVPHANYLLKIPRTDAADGNSVNLVIQYSSVNEVFHYPSDNSDFSDVLNISW